MTDGNNDQTSVKHARIEASDVDELDIKIGNKQTEGFQLVSVVHDGRSWHGFLKREVLNFDAEILHELDTLNSGVAMLINNEPRFATSDHLHELKSTLACILSVLEKRG